MDIESQSQDEQTERTSWRFNQLVTNCQFMFHTFYIFYFVGACIMVTLIITAFDSEIDETVFIDKTERNITGWERGRNQVQYATHYITNNSILSSVAENICQHENPPLVLIAVCSAVDHTKLRNAIRGTWAYYDLESYRISVAFIIGLYVDEASNNKTRIESEMFNDMVIVDLIDTYANLTLKSIYMLKWVTENCRHVRFLFKSDDDVYINIQNLIAFISHVSHQKEHELLIGNLLTNQKPIRNPESKWYMPRYAYKYDVYPNFLSGVGYLMSIDVAKRLLNISLQIELIYLEDVFITGVCAELAGIQQITQETFHYISEPPTDMNCNPYESSLILAYHHVTPRTMFEVHKNIQKCNAQD